MSRRSCSAPAGNRPVLDRSRQHALRAVAFDSHGNRLTDTLQADMIAHLGGAADLDSIDGHQDVTALETGALSGRARLDLGDDSSFGGPDAQRRRDLGREILHGDSNPATADFTILDNL